jgi:hypothetical protein
MIVVIQCAAKKREGAGYLQMGNGQEVLFVADPSSAPISNRHLYALPDDLSETGQSWRDRLLCYNHESVKNELGLCRAIEIYSNPSYDKLASSMDPENVYVLSAGWGLIRGDFLTPNYDITFSAAAEPYKRRKRTDTYRDLNMLPENNREPIVFFGGKDYVPLFCELTKSAMAQRTVFFNSDSTPHASGCSLVRFQTTTRTNWHYECLNAFLTGDIGV